MSEDQFSIIEYLLKNSDLRSSTSKAGKDCWYESYEKLKKLNPAALKRLEDILSNNKCGSESNLSRFAPYVAYARGFGYDLMDIEVALSINLDIAMERLKLLFDFPGQSDYLLVLLWDAHTYLIDFFECTFYLSFGGKRGSGKSQITEAVTYLAKDGIMLTGTTEAYFSTILNEGKTVGADEVDILLKSHKSGVLPSLFRSGYCRGSTYGFKEWIPGGKNETGRWETNERSLFGPKVFNFYYTPDPATMSRTFLILLEPTEDPLIPSRMLYKKYFLASVKLWLEIETGKTLEDWHADDIRQMILSDDFQRELEKTLPIIPRNRQIGSIALATAKLLGWDLGNYLKSWFDQSEEAATSDTEIMVAEIIILKCETQKERPIMIRTENLLIEINEKRKRMGLSSISIKKLGLILRDFGFHKRKKGHKESNWKRDRLISSENPVWFIIINDEMINHFNRIIEGNSTSDTSDTETIASLDDYFVSHVSDVLDSEGSQSEALKQSIEFVKDQFVKGTPIEAIKQIVGEEIVNECINRGYISRIGGRSS